jgi:hypothetical protein
LFVGLFVCLFIQCQFVRLVTRQCWFLANVVGNEIIVLSDSEPVPDPLDLKLNPLPDSSAVEQKLSPLADAKPPRTRKFVVSRRKGTKSAANAVYVPPPTYGATEDPSQPPLPEYFETSQWSSSEDEEQEEGGDNAKASEKGNAKTHAKANERGKSQNTAITIDNDSDSNEKLEEVESENEVSSQDEEEEEEEEESSESGPEEEKKKASPKKASGPVTVTAGRSKRKITKKK